MVRELPRHGFVDYDLPRLSQREPARRSTGQGSLVPPRTRCGIPGRYTHTRADADGKGASGREPVLTGCEREDARTVVGR